MSFSKYQLIDSEEMVTKVDRFLMNEDGSPKFQVIAFDTETNGLLLWKKVVIGFSFSVDDKSGFYLPLLIWVPDEKSLKTRSIDKIKRDIYEDGHFKCFWTGKIYPEDVTPEQYKAPDWVAVFLQRWFTKSWLVMWNAPFDVNMVFANFGVDLKDNLLLDGGLVAHIANENESVGLKENAWLYAKELGINMWADQTQEKAELRESIIKNGGTPGQVWRANLDFQCKYAVADTFLTLGLTFTILFKLEQEHGPNFLKDKGIKDWILQSEVMPVCREVVIDMKRRGVYTDVPHFKKLQQQNAIKLIQLEDEFMKEITPYLEDFPKGQSIDEAISHQRLVKEIIKMEGLSVPKVQDKKTGEWKDSIAKAVVKKEYEKNPHWIWAYMLGEDEIKYSQAKVQQIKQKLYEEVEGRRYRFNIGSNDHLIWLFFDKLGFNRRMFPKTEKSTVEDWKPSLDADTIKQFLLGQAPGVGSLLKYRKIQKIQSTYVEPALEYEINGWLYMDMKQNGTTSGRFSCSGGYNLQTLPRVDDEQEALEMCSECNSKNVEIDEYIEVMANRTCKDCGHVEYDIVRPSAIKKGFIAPPGYKIINADYSSLEPRCFAYMSNEAKIKQVYRDNLDLYSKVYCDIFDKNNQYSADPKAPNFLKKANPKGRTFIKPLVLGIPYGAGDAQCANLAGYFQEYVDDFGIKRQKPDLKRGKEIRDLYLSTYENLEAYMLERELEAVSRGYVDAIYGRRRHLEIAPIIAKVIYNKLDLSSFQMSSDFVFVKKLAQVYENQGRLQGELLESCRVLEACYNFLMLYKNDTNNKLHFSVVNKLTGIKVSMSTEDLREICKALKLRYDATDPGHTEPVADKGGWSYVRNILKGDLNNAKNHPIQGLAGHITNMGMLTTTRAFRNNGIDGWVCNQVHDEITCYARESQAELARDILQKSMEENDFTLPIRQDVLMLAEPVICDSLKESK